MSAIFGILRFDGGEVSPRDLERMGNTLAHRGPDGRKFVADGVVGLGHCLMRVNQEDLFEAQPLRDREADLTLIADLRLDNREELASEFGIAAAQLRDMPDSALVMRAYKKWGEHCAEHLLGDFAFVVWDGQKKTLTLARDHMGQRHVFYHKNDDFFAFATEIKGLWALPQVPRRLLEDSVPRSLLFGEAVEAGATGYVGILGVPGGTVLAGTTDGNLTSRRYWEPHADPAHEGQDEAYYIETYRQVLGEAVACRLRRSIAPAGLFMGGGFDSSAICALAGPVVTAQGRKLIAVSSVMPEDYRGNIRHARRWVEICRKHMPHLDVRYITREGLDLFAGMERAFLTSDWRHSTTRYITDAMYAEIAAAGARIVMDGNGGDYTLNPRFGDALARLLLNGEFRRFVFEFRATRRHLRQTRSQTLRRNVFYHLVPASWMTAWGRYRSGLRMFGTAMPLAQEFRRSLKPRAHMPRPLRKDHRAAIERRLRRLQDARAIGGSIPAAAQGLQLTQPFHDKRVVELGLAIPEALYAKNGRTRYLARIALKDLYPPEFQDRPPGNDGMEPDFLSMAKRIEPKVLAEIDRMEKAGRLAQYFDFARMRAMLTRRTHEQHESGSEFDTHQALIAFVAARYIEWFSGDNR